MERRTKAKDKRKEIDDVWVDGKPLRDYWKGSHEDTCLWAGSDCRDSLKRLTEYEEGECLGVRPYPPGPSMLSWNPIVGDDYPSVLGGSLQVPYGRLRVEDRRDRPPCSVRVCHLGYRSSRCTRRRTFCF